MIKRWYDHSFDLIFLEVWLSEEMKALRYEGAPIKMTHEHDASNRYIATDFIGKPKQSHFKDKSCKESEKNTIAEMQMLSLFIHIAQKQTISISKFLTMKQTA